MSTATDLSAAKAELTTLTANADTIDAYIRTIPTSPTAPIGSKDAMRAAQAGHGACVKMISQADARVKMLTALLAAEAA